MKGPTPAWDMAYARGLAHDHNRSAAAYCYGRPMHQRRPNKQPLKGAWARGYADRACNVDANEISPYKHRGGHGAGWGYQLNRAYQAGAECAAMNARR